MLLATKVSQYIYTTISHAVSLFLRINNLFVGCLIANDSVISRDKNYLQTRTSHHDCSVMVTIDNSEQLFGTTIGSMNVREAGGKFLEDQNQDRETVSVG
ncbi:hypothetical protein BH10CYA1_BH10CYA1_62270 [soil metagenome]